LCLFRLLLWLLLLCLLLLLLLLRLLLLRLLLLCIMARPAFPVQLLGALLALTPATPSVHQQKQQ
jgi:hypothetical protein